MGTVVEDLYVWVLDDGEQITVFIGYDHIRRKSSSYSSFNRKKLFSLADKMAMQNKLEIIRNFNYELILDA